MRDRFMQVHTLEEAEFNRVFAGRNWNHGQSIELVLRGPTGRFLPMSYIISVMCHEMAHIEQMNHGPKFQKLMAEIKADVSRLQARGYYGDGFWSDGKRLRDSVRMGGEGYRASDFPEYVCGVSAADARKAKRPTRGPGSSRAPGLVKGEASHRSGRQTEYKRKAGMKNNADMGEGGSRLDGGRQITKEDREQRKSYIEDISQALLDQGMSLTKAKKRAGEMWEEDNPWWKDGSTRGKVAKSKNATEMRAAAAEARLRALAGPSTSEIKPPITPKDEENEEVNTSEEEEDVKPVFDEYDEVDDPHINAEERRKEMEDEMNDEEREALRGGWEEYISPLKSGGSSKDLNNGIKREMSPPPQRESPSKPIKQPKIPKPTPHFGADLVRQERLKALGLASTSSSKSRTVGVAPIFHSKPTSEKDLTEKKPDIPVIREDGRSGWECKLCTFINLADHGRCEMCQARPDGSMPNP
ncbi:uncharacterized protein L201_001201 [Kwoniella dendrophila CBS 6074]|uniref:WLM domain-containing protein n=1 Tax=Kwoniella dendrophila CBS 6074 TaxID=1295534 RepID=A0AAX4JN47_9TREE